MKDSLRIGAFISGGGRTVLNLAQALDRDGLDAEISVVVAHQNDVPGVQRCRSAGLDVRVVHRDPAISLSNRIDDVLLQAQVDLVCLCGYLQKFSVGDRWAGRIINIHPALLPAFGGKGMYGKHVHEAVITSGVTESGCTVHFVDEQYDHGPTILQRKCPVLPSDSAQELADRVFAEECVAYPEVISQILQGHVQLMQI